MRRAGDAGIESPHHPAHGALQFQVHPLGIDIAPGSHVQGALDRQDIVHGGDDELCLGDQAVLDAVMMDQGAARRFDHAVTFSIAGRVSHGSLGRIERLRQDFHGPFQRIHQLNPPARSNSRMAWAGCPNAS